MTNDLQERLFAFAVRVVRFCQFLDEKPGVGRVLSKQLLRSATSTGANYEEAQAGQSRADFIAKNCIALKEARETHYWIRLLATIEVVPTERVGPLLEEADQLRKILGAIVARSRNGTG